jgi:Transcriptional regulators
MERVGVQLTLISGRGSVSGPMTPRVRVTHRDIADRTGFDKSTVSLALRGSPRIAAETRRAIQAAAVELGYRPDPIVSALARQRWMRCEQGRGAAIAYLVERKKGDYWLQHRHFTAANERAEERGYLLSEFDLSDYPNGAAASRALYHRGIRGLVLPSMPSKADADFHGFDWDKFTVVCCSVGWLRTPFHVVTSDMFEGTRRAWRELVARGYRRIGAALCRHTPVAIDDHTRLGASYAEQCDLDASHERIPFLLGDPDDKAGFLAWLERYRPDAVIGLVPPMAQWMREAGVRIPEDVGFVSLHSYPDQPVAGLCVERETVARTAIDLLISQMLENQWSVPSVQQVVHIKPRWIEGDTLRKMSGPTPETEADWWRGAAANDVMQQASG